MDNIMHQWYASHHTKSDTRCRKGSILVVSLWILAIFVMLVLSLGLRSNIEAKFSLRLQEYFEARQTLYSTMNLAHYYIQMDDDRAVDSANDAWYNQIEISEDVWPDNNIVLIIKDEERKINVNLASEKALTLLCEYIDQKVASLRMSPEDIAEAIVSWRGERKSEKSSKQNQTNKGQPFESLAELLLIDDFVYEDYAILKEYLTVYGDASILKININTASEPVLHAIIYSLAGDERRKRDMFDKIVAYRLQTTESNDMNVNQTAVFTPKDLSPYALLNMIGLTSDVVTVSLALQLVKHCSANSEYYDVYTAIQDNNKNILMQAQAVITLHDKGMQLFTVHAWNEIKGYEEA